MSPKKGHAKIHDPQPKEKILDRVINTKSKKKINSAFYDTTADEMADTVIIDNMTEIENWLKTDKPNKTVSTTSVKPIGHGYDTTDGHTIYKETKVASLILIRDATTEKGYIVSTCYPNLNSKTATIIKDDNLATTKATDSYKAAAPLRKAMLESACDNTPPYDQISQSSYTPASISDFIFE